MPAIDQTDLATALGVVDRLARIETKLDNLLTLEIRVVKLEQAMARTVGFAIGGSAVLSILIQLLQ